MQVRIGKCTSCEAEYQVPVEFDQPWAKCLICEGPVRIGEPQDPPKPRRGAAAAAGTPPPPAAPTRGATAPAPGPADTAPGPADAAPAPGAAPTPVAAPSTRPEPPVQAAPPVPAAPEPDPEPEPASEAQLEEAELELEPLPADEPPPAPSKGGTLERLKAERQAQEAAADGGPRLGGSTLDRLKAQRRAQEQALQGDRGAPQPGSTLERLKAERRAQAVADGAAPIPARRAVPAETASASRSEAGGSKGRRAAGGEEGDEGAGRSGGRRSSGGARRRGAAGARSKEKNPAVLWGAVGTLVVIAGGLYGLSAGWFEGGGAAEDAPDEDAVAAAEPTHAAPKANPFADLGLAGDAQADGTETEGAATDAGASGAPAAAAPAPAAPAPAPTPAPEKPAKDPDSVDLDALPALEPVAGTSDEEWAKLLEDAGKLVDERGGIGTTRARGRLIEAGRSAMPAILMAWRELDLSTDAGVRVGLYVSRTLEELTSGITYGWRQGTGPDEEYFNKRVVEEWTKKWLQVGYDDAAWERFANPTPAAPKPPADGEQLEPEEFYEAIGGGQDG